VEIISNNDMQYRIGEVVAFIIEKARYRGVVTGVKCDSSTEEYVYTLELERDWDYK
jgi:hypothetical protein